MDIDDFFIQIHKNDFSFKKILKKMLEEMLEKKDKRNVLINLNLTNSELYLFRIILKIDLIINSRSKVFRLVD